MLSYEIFTWRHMAFGGAREEKENVPKHLVLQAREKEFEFVEKREVFLPL